jgi:hypothetical protein
MARLTLEELVRQLGLVYGAGLRCVALYGSAARGEHNAKRSDLNVLVIVDAITMQHLRAEGALARSWRDAGNPPPLTLTLAEWRGSADIFPIEYADILAHHRVLHGAFPGDGIRIDPQHLRLQLEHEAMSKLLRLRHAVLQSSGDGRALADLLAASLSSILVLLRAALRLSGEEPAADSTALLERVGDRTRIPVDAFRRVLEASRHGAEIDRDSAPEITEAFLAGVGALVSYVNAVPPSAAP